MRNEVLEQIGLNKNEVIVYQVLLTNGEMIPSDLADKTGLSRTNTYMILKSLVQKGIVEEFDRKKKLTYRVEPPQKLLEYVEKRKKELEKNEKTLTALLPNLVSDYNLAHNKPGIAYYEGAEGIRKIFELLYAPKNEPVLGCVDLECLKASFPNLTQVIIPSRKENRVKTLTFFADSPEARERTSKNTEELRKGVLLDKKKYPIPAEIDVFEDKIAMLDFSKGKFTGIVIENKAMAASLKSIMKLAFESKGIKH